MGKDEETEKYTPASTGMVRRVRQPLFEKDLLTAGADIISSFTVGVFRDEQALVDACLYIGQLDYWGMEKEIEIALWKLNGTMAIGGRARKEAVQAHGNLYFPEDGSKEDKKQLAEMQFRRRREDDDHDGQQEH